MVVLHIIRHYFTQGYARKVFIKAVTRHCGGHQNLLSDNVAVDAAGSRSPSPKKSALDLRPRVSRTAHCLRYHAANKPPGTPLFYRKHPSVAISPCTKLLHIEKAIQASLRQTLSPCGVNSKIFFYATKTVFTFDNFFIAHQGRCAKWFTQPFIIYTTGIINKSQTTYDESCVNRSKHSPVSSRRSGDG